MKVEVTMIMIMRKMMRDNDADNDENENDEKKMGTNQELALVMMNPLKKRGVGLRTPQTWMLKNVKRKDLSL